MEVGKAIYYLLKDSDDVGAIAGDRIYPEIAQQDAPTPFVAYSVSSTTPSGVKSNSSELDTARVELYVVGSDYAETMDLAIACRSALDRQGGSIGPVANPVQVQSIDFEGSDTDHDPTQDVYIVEHIYNVRVQRTGVISGYNVIPANAIAVSEADGTPSGNVTSLVFSNGSLTIDGNSATIASGGGSLTIQEQDGTPSDVATTLVFPNASVTIDGNTATLDLATGADATTLQDNIDAEATARASADTTLQDNIDAEATTRATADTNLQASIDGLTIEDVDNTGILEQLAEQLASLNGLSSSDFPNGLIGDFNQDGNVGSADLILFLGYFETSLSASERSARLSSYVGNTLDVVDPVRSINGETGDREGDVSLTTSLVPEGTRLYYTDARADARIEAALISDLADIPDGIGTAGQVLSVNADRTGYEFTNKTPSYSSPYELRTLSVSADFLEGGTSEQDFTGTTPLKIALNTSVATYNANSTTSELNGVTIDEAGVYRFSFSAELTSTGARATPAAFFYLNNAKQLGTSHGYIRNANGVAHNSLNLSRTFSLSAQDFVEVRIYDSSTLSAAIACTSAVLDIERLA